MVAVTGGFPRGKTAGHNFDLVKAKLTNWLLELGLVTYTTTSSDFYDVQRWLPDCHFLITYVAGPVPEEGDNTYIQDWLSSGGRWLAIHGTSGGKADRTPGAVGMVKMVGPTAHFTAHFPAEPADFARRCADPDLCCAGLSPNARLPLPWAPPDPPLHRGRRRAPADRRSSPKLREPQAARFHLPCLHPELTAGACGA